MECKNCKFCEFSETFEDYFCIITNMDVCEKVSKNKCCDISFRNISMEMIESLRVCLLEDNDKLIDFLDGRYDENMNQAEICMAFYDSVNEKNSKETLYWLNWFYELRNY